MRNITELEQNKIIEKAKKKKKIKKKEYITNSFWHYAEVYRTKPIEQNEIMKNDVTDLFWTEFFTMLKENEIVNMNINAPPGEGKSTVAMQIGNDGCKYRFNREINLMDIDRDQQEYSIKMRDKKVQNTIRIIDEWNDLEATGENSTIERAMTNYFSDVMAQRKVHKISCSPSEMIDKNATIFLRVFSTDKVRKTTHCILGYRIYDQGVDYVQDIGVVSINVAEVMEKKWYKDYRRRKFEKFDLILEEGIFRPRDLITAKPRLKIIEELEPLTKYNTNIRRGLIKNYVEIKFREAKIPLSIIGNDGIVERVSGVLDTYKVLYMLVKEHNKLFNGRKNMSDLDFKNRDKRILNMKQDIEKVRKVINAQIEELNKLININDKYNRI